MDKKGKTVSEEAAYARMARICSQKECAPSDITRKLAGMGLPDPLADKVIARLKKGGYLDEKRFISSYVHDKLYFNKWGKRKIALSLARKQLPQVLVEEALSALPGELYGESLKAVLAKKWASVKGKSDYEKRGKLIRYALGRGFSLGEVTDCMRQMGIGGAFDGTE